MVFQLAPPSVPFLLLLTNYYCRPRRCILSAICGKRQRKISAISLVAFSFRTVSQCIFVDQAISQAAAAVPASSSSCCKHWVRSSPRWMAFCFSDWPFRWKFMKLRSNWAELTPLKDPAAAKMPAAAAAVAAASRPIHSSIQSSQSRVSELRNAFVVTLHGPRLRLALCGGDGDVFFLFTSSFKWV